MFSDGGRQRVLQRVGDHAQHKQVEFMVFCHDRERGAFHVHGPGPRCFGQRAFFGGAATYPLDRGQRRGARVMTLAAEPPQHPIAPVSGRIMVYPRTGDTARDQHVARPESALDGAGHPPTDQCPDALPREPGRAPGGGPLARAAQAQEQVFFNLHGGGDGEPAGIKAARLGAERGADAESAAQAGSASRLR